MKVLIVLDNPKRDLECVSLLAARLKSNGHSVAVTLIANLKFSFYHYRPDHVLLNYLRINNQAFVKEVLKYKVAYSVLDTEGVGFVKLEDGQTSYDKTIIDDVDLKKNLANYFCWGEDTYNYLLNKNIYDKKTLVLTGTPRTDVYYYYKTQSSKDDRLKHVLVNTSFPMINPKFASAEKEKSNLLNNFNYSKDYVEKKLVFLKDVQKEYIDLTKFLSEKLPAVKIVFRPHPFENETYYKDFFQNHKNVSVICEGGVAKWISDSILLVHFECSTAIEAGMLSKLSLSLEKFKGKFPVEDTYPFTTFCKDFDEILGYVQDQIKNPTPVSYDSSLASCYYKVDGLAHERIADKISQGSPVKAVFSKFRMRTFYLMLLNLVKSSLKIAKSNFKPKKKILPAELADALSIAHKMTGKKITYDKSYTGLYWNIE